MAKKLAGQTFVVTGTLAGYSRAEAKKEIEALGGKVSGSVSANTDCVVVGEDPGSKADKAKQFGIKTLNEAAFKRLLGGTKKKAAKKKATKKADASAKAQPADQKAAKITSAELRQYVSKIKKLLTQRDYSVIDSGIELARSLAEAAVFEELLQGCTIDKEEQLVNNKLFTGTGPAQPYLNYALISMIAYAPKDCVSAVTLRRSITRLTMVLFSTEPLAEFKNLVSLNLNGSGSLQKVDGLANCTKLTNLNLSNSDFTSLPVGLDKILSLTHLDLKNCAALGTVVGLQKCTALQTLILVGCNELTSLKLNGLPKLNVLNLDECWKLKKLELSHLPSLSELSLIGDSRSWHYAGILYTFIELEELKLDSLSSLESVDISWVYPLTKLIISDCPALQSLKREELELNDQSWHHTHDLRLQNLPKIRYLRLSRLPFTSTKTLRGLKMVEKLDMEDCTELTDLKGIAGMTSLTHLNISNCTSLSDIKGLEGAKSLRMLTAKRCSELTDPSAIRGLDNLVGADFNGCKKLRPVPTTKLLAGRSDMVDYQLQLFTSVGEKAPRGFKSTDRATKILLKETFTKLKKLFRSYELDQINAGVELVISLDSPVLFEKLLTGGEVDEEGHLVAGPLLRAPTSSSSYKKEDQQRNLDVGFLKLLQAAPKIALKNSGGDLITNCVRLDLSYRNSLQNVDFLANFTKLSELNLSGCDSLQNIDGLANCTKLTELNLSGCDFLQNVDVLANCVKLTKLDLGECNSLQNVDFLANFTKLSELNLSGCDSLQNIDGLPNCTKLSYLDLSYCTSLKNVDVLKTLTKLTELDLSGCKQLRPKSGQVSMSSLEEVSAYLELVKKSMK